MPRFCSKLCDTLIREKVSGFSRFDLSYISRICFFNAIFQFHEIIAELCLYRGTQSLARGPFAARDEVSLSYGLLLVFTFFASEFTQQICQSLLLLWRSFFFCSCFSCGCRGATKSSWLAGTFCVI